MHHFALLIGYGVSAINPYLAFETIDHMIDSGLLPGVDYRKACGNFVKAAAKGDKAEKDAGKEGTPAAPKA